MAKALSRPLDNLVRIPGNGNIEGIFNCIMLKEAEILKEKRNREDDYSSQLKRLKSLSEIEGIVYGVMKKPGVPLSEYGEVKILQNLHVLKNEGGIPLELGQVISIDDFLALSTYNIEERANVLMYSEMPIGDFVRMVDNLHRYRSEDFISLDKSLQKAISISQNFDSNVKTVLLDVGIVNDLHDIIFNYLEGFRVNNAKNIISKIDTYNNVVFLKLLESESIIPDHCETPAILGEVDAPNL